MTDDPGRTHYYGDGCDEPHGHDVPLIKVLEDERTFAWTDDTDLNTAVGEAMGAASACWSNLEGAGVFDSERAVKLVDELVAFIHRWTGDTPSVDAPKVQSLRVTPLDSDANPAAIRAGFVASFGAPIQHTVTLRLAAPGSPDTHEHTDDNVTVWHNHEHGSLRHTHPDLSAFPKP